MTEGPTQLHWFDSPEAVERFANTVMRAYIAAMKVTEASGLATGDERQAVLLTSLVQRMMSYSIEQTGALLAPELEEALTREIEALWPMFKDQLDSQIADAAELFEALHPGAVEKPN